MRIRKTMSFLFVLLTSFLTSAIAFAEEAAQEAGGAAGELKIQFLSAALVLGAAATFGALGQAKTASTALEGIARNPNAAPKLFTPMLLGLALIESLVIYALIVAIMLVLA